LRTRSRALAGYAGVRRQSLPAERGDFVMGRFTTRTPLRLPSPRDCDASSVREAAICGARDGNTNSRTLAIGSTLVSMRPRHASVPRGPARAYPRQSPLRRVSRNGRPPWFAPDLGAEQRGRPAGTVSIALCSPHQRTRSHRGESFRKDSDQKPRQPPPRMVWLLSGVALPPASPCTPHPLCPLFAVTDSLREPDAGFAGLFPLMQFPPCDISGIVRAVRFASRDTGHQWRRWLGELLERS